LNTRRTSKPFGRGTKPKSQWSSAAARHLFHITDYPQTIDDAIYLLVKRYLDGVSCPPTDLHAAAAKAKVAEIVGDDLPVSGELRRKGKHLTIVYSKGLSEARRRFTIAHELAHAIFEHTMERPTRKGEELERLCDLLASEIVMPREFFLSFASKEPSVVNLLELCQTFKTSLSATGIRYAKLKKVSVFYIDHETITWGSGVVRKGPLSALDSGLRLALAEFKASKQSTENILLDTRTWAGEWRVEYHSFQDGNRALCLLEPKRTAKSVPSFI
jgi:hypothetical protein